MRRRREFLMAWAACMGRAQCDNWGVSWEAWGRGAKSAKRCDVDHCVSSVLGHCALRTRCIRQLELRRSWQPKRNFVFNLRPSRRDAGHALSKYSGKPKRSSSTQLLMLRRVDISLKPSASSETRRDATNSLTNFFAAGFFRGPGQFARPNKIT